MTVVTASSLPPMDTSTSYFLSCTSKQSPSFGPIFAQHMGIKGSSSVHSTLVQHNKPMLTFLTMEGHSQPGFAPNCPSQGAKAGRFLESWDVPWFISWTVL